MIIYFSQNLPQDSISVTLEDPVSKPREFGQISIGGDPSLNISKIFHWSALWKLDKNTSSLVTWLNSLTLWDWDMPQEIDF